MSKICVMTSVHPARDVRIYHKQARSLAQAGNDVTLLNSFIEETDDVGIKFVKVSVAQSRFKRVLFGAKKMYKAALEQDADIYHFHDPELYKTGLKLLKRGKVIYDVHEDVPMQLRDKPYLNPLVRKIWSKMFGRIEKKAALKYSGIINAEEPVEQLFKQAGCKNTVTVGNFPILSELSCDDIAYSERKNKIGYIGSISKVRGITETVKSLEYIDSTLVLAGKFNEQKLFDETSALESWQKVDFKGFVDRGEVREILKEIKVGLVTLYPIKNYINSFPVKMFEYMAAGIPVVCSDFPFWRELLIGVDCALFVDPYDSKAIADAVNKLLCDPGLAEKMGEEGKIAVKDRFNWDIEKAKLLKFYDDIVQ